MSQTVYYQSCQGVIKLVICQQWQATLCILLIILYENMSCLVLYCLCMSGLLSYASSWRFGCCLIVSSIQWLVTASLLPFIWFRLPAYYYTVHRVDKIPLLFCWFTSWKTNKFFCGVSLSTLLYSFCTCIVGNTACIVIQWQLLLFLERVLRRSQGFLPNNQRV